MTNKKEHEQNHSKYRIERQQYSLVLGLQVPGHLPGVDDGGGARVELDPGAGLGLDVQLEGAEVVPLPEDVAGGLAQVAVRGGSHHEREEHRGEQEQG